MKDGNGRLDDGDGRGVDKFDGLIDLALGSYTPRDPRAGLESRILSRIAAAEVEQSRSGWSWKPAWALAAAMALLAVAGVPLGYRLGWQESAVTHRPEIRQPAVAEVGHSVQAAPLTARSVRHALTSHERIAGAKAEGMEIAANTSPAAMERASVAPVEDKPSADEVSTLKPITLKSITIAPIQIAALN
jgi:hypothetical protein